MFKNPNNNTNQSNQLNNKPITNKSHNIHRVKLYKLESEGKWKDQGTAHVICKYLTSLQAPGLLITKEDNPNEIILQSKIQQEDIYERQGDYIIMWRETQRLVDQSNSSFINIEADYALSFEEIPGCLAIWDAIGEVQSQYLQQNNYSIGSPFVLNKSSLHNNINNFVPTDEMIDDSIDSSFPSVSKDNLLGIKKKLNDAISKHNDAITKHSEHIGRHLDECISRLIRQECEYLRKLLVLFDLLEIENDVKSLNLLCEVWRAALMLGDQTILKFALSDCFMTIVGIFEYDPALGYKANYRNFLSNQSKLNEVVPIEESNIKQSIHNLYRMKYLKDYLIRPAIDEPGIACLTSLIMYTSIDIATKMFDNTTYLQKIFDVINYQKFKQNSSTSSSSCDMIIENDNNKETKRDINNNINTNDINKRLDGIKFLRELFFLTRNFNIERRYELYCSFLRRFKDLIFQLVIDALYPLTSNNTFDPIIRQTETLLMAEVMSTLSSICPGEIRQVILSNPLPSMPQYMLYNTTTTTGTNSSNDRHCLLLSVIMCLLYNDHHATIEHCSDIIKLLLDPENHRLVNLINNTANGSNNNQHQYHTLLHEYKQLQEKFLAVFYDHYIFWMLIPFVDSSSYNNSTSYIDSLEENYQGNYKDHIDSHVNSFSGKHQREVTAIATSKKCLVEIFTLCVLGHEYRMKYFIIRNNVIGKLNQILIDKQTKETKHLQLNITKFYRSIILAKDEFYYRHIIKFDLFRPLVHLLESQIVSKVDKNINSKGDSTLDGQVDMQIDESIPSTAQPDIPVDGPIDSQLNSPTYLLDNCITSSIIELFECIRCDNISSLIIYLVDKYANKWTGLLRQQFNNLLIRYDQIIDGQKTFNNTNSFITNNNNNRLNNKRNNRFEQLNNEESYFEFSSSDEQEDVDDHVDRQLERQIEKQVRRIDKRDIGEQFDRGEAIVNNVIYQTIQDGLIGLPNYSQFISPANPIKKSDSLTLLSDLYDDYDDYDDEDSITSNKRLKVISDQLDNSIDNIVDRSVVESVNNESNDLLLPVRKKQVEDNDTFDEYFFNKTNQKKLATHLTNKPITKIDANLDNKLDNQVDNKIDSSTDSKIDSHINSGISIVLNNKKKHLL